MSKSQSIAQTPGYPLKVMGLVLVLVFVAEGLIMLILPSITAWRSGSVAESMVDATLLATALAPALWFVIVRPLRRVLRERGMLLRRVFEAQEQERSNLGRDLHDQLGQELTAILIGLRSLENQAESAAARERTTRLLAIASTSLEHVRTMARGLRAGVLEDFGLAVAIQRLCEEFRDMHGSLPDFRSQLTSGRRFEHEIEIAAYRLAQGTLTNIARHSQAKSIHIVLAESENVLTLHIRDDGRGFDVKSVAASENSMGLRSMRERIELLGGTWQIHSAPGAGTDIYVKIPVASIRTSKQALTPQDSEG